jgi:hypothetical protein
MGNGLLEPYYVEGSVLTRMFKPFDFDPVDESANESTQHQSLFVFKMPFRNQHPSKV